MKDDDNNSSNAWVTNLLVLFFVALMVFITWQKWLKPPVADQNAIVRSAVRSRMQKAASHDAKPAVTEIVIKNETLGGDVKKASVDAIPIVERDAAVLDRQGERLRKESESSRASSERGPRPTALSETAIRDLERKKAILQ